MFLFLSVNSKFAAQRLIFLAALLLFIAAVGCAPLKSEFTDNFPALLDDGSRSSIETAVRKSIDHLQEIPADRQFNFCGNYYPASRLLASLETFADILDRSASAEQLQDELANNFIACRAGRPVFFGLFRKILVTGYYEPLLEGSLVKSPPYIYPLYKVPPDLVSNSATGPDNINKGRIVDGEMLPYWTRAEIENTNVLAGNELLYLADPFDAFTLHVQGSGRVRLRDGSVRGVYYAGKNGRPYSSIGKLLADEGIIPLVEVNMPRIRQYLTDHPADRQRVLHHNESFVFFRWGDTESPIGSLGRELTAGRSVAADHNSLPPAGLGFLITKKPIIDNRDQVDSWTDMSRFVLIQDSGSAIKGPGRLDFFWGNGDYARTAAGMMKHPGKLYLLLNKNP